jgi:putative phosphoesterase
MTTSGRHWYIGMEKKEEFTQKDDYVVGVISDTHGLLRPEVLQAFEKVDLVLHAGDIGGPEVLDALRKLAPVTAVRGNMDYGTWAGKLSETERLDLGGITIFMIHDMFGVHFGHAADNDVQVVISGHTHRPHIERRLNILFLNPGTAGYHRSLYPVSVGLLFIRKGRPNAEIITLG